jgi:hypothetical protein
MNSLNHPQSSQPRQNSTEVAPQPATRPTMDQVIQAICRDARHESLKYALRSNTGHDGE